MNNKGFTLVELLATIVILGIVLSIATISVISIINKSKEKGEAMFNKNLGDAIQSYIADNRLNWNRNTDVLVTFDKCNRVDNNGKCITKGKYSKVYSKELYTIYGTGISDSSFSLEKLIEGNYIQGKKIINPKNKQDCMRNIELSVKLYKDNDSVYYYYVDLSKGTCEVSEKNAIVSNIPKNVCSVLDAFGYSWKENVCKNEN